ncbi:MAG: glycosyltransferase family 2 protein [Planctomycetota bacterium]
MKTTVATPRLSIVLPVLAATEVFEETLLSVLENQPPACEVLVVHDGRYQDPFDLADEVRFVHSDSGGLIDGIAAGCDAAWGRYVHVLAGGAKATEGWTIDALRRFEDFDVASVTPVLRTDRDGEIVAAGWRDTAAGLMRPLDAGQRAASGEDRRLGVYLNASFWRREVLRSLTRACATTDPLIATYAYRHLQATAGWRSTLAPRSEVHVADLGDVGKPSWRRGRILRSLKQHFGQSAGVAGVIAALQSVLRGGDIGEATGQIAGVISPIKTKGNFEASEVYSSAIYEQSRRAA